MQKERALGPLLFCRSVDKRMYSLSACNSSSCRLRCGGRSFYFFFLPIHLLSSLADIDSALEEGAVFDGDSGCHYVAGERTVAADIYAVAGAQVSLYFAEHYDFAGIDVGRDYAVTSYGHAISRKVDGTFYASIDIERFGSGHLAFNDERFADGCLVRGRTGHRTWCCWRFADRRGCRGHAWALLFYRPSRGGVGLIGWFPHDG